MQACLEVRNRANYQEAIRCLAETPGWTVVALDYELGYLFEPKAAPPEWREGESVLARFWRFADCQPLSATEAEAWLQSKVGEGAEQIGGVGGLQPQIDEAAYTTAVDRIKRLIFEGDCYQVNFTFPIAFSWFGSPWAIYARLRARQPVRYGGVIGDARSARVSLSPELFLERHGPRLVTRPMKGTAPRTQSAETLLASAKDRAENLMIVDLLRNDLGRVATPGSVSVDELFAIEAYPTVWQMASEVSADVGQRSFGEVLEALFPCGSITGAPKVRAMQVIGELECQARGGYTGALGWLAPNGDFRLNVAIRTLQLDADGRGCLGVGSGVVADSEAAAEWQECQLKAAFLRDCDPGLLLIETLRREQGGYPRLARHLARLRRSAAWLGFPLDESRLEQCLAAQPASGMWRIRLTLDKTGCLSVAHFPLTDEPSEYRQAILSATPIDSTYPLRGYKTSDRAVYDSAMQSISSDPDVFDVVFLNERGEVAEGARSNVFVERDGHLLTPPLSSGALPGVLRAELLDSGRATEAVLYPEDLASGFWLGNALRGLIAVHLRST